MIKVYTEQKPHIVMEGTNSDNYFTGDLEAYNEDWLVSIRRRKHWDRKIIEKVPHTEFTDNNGNALWNLEETISELNNIYNTEQELSAVQVNALISAYFVSNPIKKPLFNVWAEENSSLSSNTLEWAFGNGANAPEDQWVVVPVDCELVFGTLSLKAGTATVWVYKNGSKVFDIVWTSKNNSSTVPAPVRFNAWDCVWFKTILASLTSTPNIVTAWFREI